MRRIWLVPLGAFVLGACGGRVRDDDPSPTPADAARSSNDAAFVDTDVDPPIDDATLAWVCGRIVDATCGAATRDCCQSSAPKWDEAGCRSRAAQACAERAAQVKAGKRSYDPARLADCVVEWNAAAKSCTVAKADAVRLFATCDVVFPDTTTERCTHVDCESNADCPSSIDLWGSCSPAAGECVWLRGTSRASYAGGLCDIVCPVGESMCAGTEPGVERCAPAIADGAGCSASMDGCCDWGWQCSGGRCLPGRDDGTSCDRPWECASTSCSDAICVERPSEDPSPQVTSLATRALCEGAPGYERWAP